MKTLNPTRPLLWILLVCSIHLHAQSDTLRQPEECTVLLQDGDKLLVNRFWRIEDGLVEYEQGGSLHDLRATEIQAITCGSRSYVIECDSLLLAQPTTLDGARNFFELGRADAAEHYHGGGAFVASFVTSPLLIVAPIIAAVPPVENMRNNPNAALYDTNPDYRRGYRKMAHEKKAAHAIFGMSLGLALIIGMAAR